MYLLRNNTVIQTETVVDDAMQHDLFLLTSTMGADNRVLLLKHLRVLQSGLLLHSHNTHLYKLSLARAGIYASCLEQECQNNESLQR